MCISGHFMVLFMVEVINFNKTYNRNGRLNADSFNSIISFRFDPTRVTSKFIWKIC